jgi:hypothetical protein
MVLEEYTHPLQGRHEPKKEKRQIVQERWGGEKSLDPAYFINRIKKIVRTLKPIICDLLWTVLI